MVLRVYDRQEPLKIGEREVPRENVRHDWVIRADYIFLVICGNHIFSGMGGFVGDRAHSYGESAG